MMLLVVSGLMTSSSVTFQSLALHMLSHHFKHTELKQNCFQLKSDKREGLLMGLGTSEQTPVFQAKLCKWKSNLNSSVRSQF